MKQIAKCFVFASSSTPGKFYDTLLYTDGTTSCPCPGWTRRVARDGSRSCAHTRLVETGIGEQAALKVKTYSEDKTYSERAYAGQPFVAPRPSGRKTKAKAKPEVQPAPRVTRRFEF